MAAKAPSHASLRRIKILSMGDAQAGKSCLIKRYCEQKFVARYIPTIGVDFGVKSVLLSAPGTATGMSRTVELKVNFWDLSGHPEFFQVRNEFYEGTQGMLLVFDVTSRKSFQALDAWLRESVKYGAKPVVTVVCANKTDLAKSRIVSAAEARTWAQQHGFQYFETSCHSGANVSSVFDFMFQAITDSGDASC